MKVTNLEILISAVYIPIQVFKLNDINPYLIYG